MPEDDSLEQIDPAIEQEIDALMGRSAPSKAAKAAKTPKPSKRRQPGYWQNKLMETGVARQSAHGNFTSGILRALGKILFFPLISSFGSYKKFDPDGNVIVQKHPLAWRIFSGLVMRALLTPLILIAFLMVLVWLTTHPQHVQAVLTPEARSLYFENVGFESSDGQPLRAWYIPPLTAARVTQEHEAAFNLRYPAAVLVHDLGAAADQYLPLADELHQNGFAVLLLDPRGQGASANAAVTFGLRERFDVLAAVRFVREHQDIDPAKVCVIGKGMGATAAAQAAALDGSIAALVVDEPWLSFDDRTERVFTRVGLPGKPAAMVFHIAFETMLREHVESLDLMHLGRDLKQPVLVLVHQVADPSASIMNAQIQFASNIAGPHRTALHGEGDVANQHDTVDFLKQSLHWKNIEEQASENIDRLLHSQVK